MKTRLDQLTMAEFIDMLCGNTGVIAEQGEPVAEEEVEKVVSDLANRYKSIVDPAGSKSAVIRDARLGKRGMRIMFLRLCAALLRVGDKENVYEMLTEYGWDVKEKKPDDVSRKCEREFKRLEAEEKREREKRDACTAESAEDDSEESVRARFSAELASIITYYKMPISFSAITADVYANIVARAYREAREHKSKNKTKVNR